MKQTAQIIPTGIISMMTGVWRIQRAHDLVTLEYTDGTRESGKIELREWALISGNVFSIVSTVQSQRVKASS